MIVDFAGCYVVEKACKALFADLEPAELVTRGRERRERRRLEQEKEKKEMGENGTLPELSEVVKKTQ
jgi:cation-transporting ATPase 13A1